MKRHPADALALERGTIHDYDALARFHYKAARPATHVHVLVLRAPPTRRAEPFFPDPAAVLVVSMPTLNGRWREHHLPGLPPARDSAGKRERTRWLNANLRCISRVVVEPRFRGLGLARRLVAAYLRRPRTRCTEAVATMGAYCPFFQAAGMTPVEFPRARHDARLLALLERAGLDTADLPRFARTGRPRHAERLGHELRAWARASRRTARRADAPIHELAILAARTLTAQPMAFVHVARAGGTPAPHSRVRRAPAGPR